MHRELLELPSVGTCWAPFSLLAPWVQRPAQTHPSQGHRGLSAPPVSHVLLELGMYAHGQAGPRSPNQGWLQHPDSLVPLRRLLDSAVLFFLRAGKEGVIPALGVCTAVSPNPQGGSPRSTGEALTGSRGGPRGSGLPSPLRKSQTPLRV